MIKPKFPCKDCQKRHENCWGECEEYQKHLAEHRAVDEARHKYVEAEMSYTPHTQREYQMMRTRYAATHKKYRND